jgi:hypothetical protein
METGIVQDMLTNPVGSVKDLVLQIAVMYFLIYKPALWKIQEMKRKRNGGAPKRRKSDPTNPLNITATDPGNPGNPGSEPHRRHLNGRVTEQKLKQIDSTMERIEEDLKNLTVIVHKVNSRVSYLEGAHRKEREKENGI